MWPFSLLRRSAPPEAPAEKPKRRGEYSTSGGNDTHNREVIERYNAAITPQPMATYAMDDGSGGAPLFKAVLSEIPEALLAWYASQRFIGYQMCATIAQHWLVDKVCSMPARDAVRHGFEIQAYGEDETVLDDDQIADIDEKLKRADRKHKLFRNMVEYVRMGRVFGIRVAFFKIRDAGPDFYANPFNIDGVTQGSYEGIVQVDPYWCVPLLSEEAASDPASMHFYEPEWWLIRGQKYHRTHLMIFRNGDVPDILKPMYNYGGISVSQKVYERVYAAERTANEAPQLAMTKRTIVQKTDLTAIFGDPETFKKHMQANTTNKDNYGTWLVDEDDDVVVQDTSLNDLDAVIMTQYQLVAAEGGVPATKLLGTTPKGFNSSGDYESQSYHEELETIQANDLTEFVNRHHMLVMRSEVEPELGLIPGSVRIEIDWNPVDSPTAKEYAEINKLNAETDNILATVGAVDAIDVRNRLRTDNNSGYSDLAELEAPTIPNPPEDDDILGSLTGETVPEETEIETTSGAALNGAQVTALIGVVSQVAKGDLPRSSGIEIMKSAYKLPSEEAERLMGEAGKNGTQEENPLIPEA